MKLSNLHIEHRLITLVALGITGGFLLAFAWVF